MPCRRKKTTIKKTRHFSRTALLLAALLFAQLAMGFAAGAARADSLNTYYLAEG